jgi:NSS family neurotransmitter:Na+ symporter
MIIFTAIVIIAGFAVLLFGVKNGLEQINKIIMIGMFVLIFALMINSALLENAADGIKFYLLPNFENIREIGIFKVITAAMSQAFFTLSIGMGAMEIFGSYMSDEHTLPGEAIRISILDTIVALSSGMIIFPACSSFNISPDEGPSLIFVTLPRVFAGMPGGRIWGMLFFLFMTFASFSTVIAVFENLVASGMDNFNFSRKKAIFINVIVMLIGSLPCALGFNVLSNVTFFGGMDILGAEDFLVSNILLPVGSLIFVLFCSYKFGWGADSFLAEANKGKGIKISSKLIPFFRYILPVLILVILISGLF